MTGAPNTLTHLHSEFRENINVKDVLLVTIPVGRYLYWIALFVFETDFAIYIVLDDLEQGNLPASQGLGLEVYVTTPSFYDELCVCVCHRTYVKVKGQPWVLVYFLQPCLRQKVSLLFTTVYSRLAGLRDPGDSPVSAFILP